MGRTIELIICDFDNTLVQSEKVNAEIFTRFFASIASIEAIGEDRNIVDSAAFLEVIRHFKSRYYHKLGDITERALETAFLEWKEHEINQFEIPKAQGVDLLLSTGIPLAIVSGSHRREINAVAGVAGLPLSPFQLILGSNEYYPWKPDPSGFKLAASFLKANPERTYVLEDSRFGIQAARRAGMNPVFIEEFTDTKLVPEERNASLQFFTIEDFLLSEVIQ